MNASARGSGRETLIALALLLIALAAWPLHLWMWTSGGSWMSIGVLALISDRSRTPLR